MQNVRKYINMRTKNRQRKKEIAAIAIHGKKAFVSGKIKRSIKNQ